VYICLWRYPVDFAVHYNIHYITFTILACAKHGFERSCEVADKEISEIKILNSVPKNRKDVGKNTTYYYSPQAR
jgi:hypothetical protein